MTTPWRLDRLTDEDLARLVRDGHRRALDELSGRLCPRVSRLAAAIAGDPETGMRAARDALAVAVWTENAPIRSTTMREAQRLAAARRTEADLGDLAGLTPTQRSVVVACEVEGLSTAEAAEELDLDVDQVRVQLRRSLRTLGAPTPPRCIGWSLVERLPRLDDEDAAAAHGHIDLCEDCRDAYEARDALRRRLSRRLPVYTAPAAALAGLAVAGGAALAPVVAVTARTTLLVGALSIPAAARAQAEREARDHATRPPAAEASESPDGAASTASDPGPASAAVTSDGRGAPRTEPATVGDQPGAAAEEPSEAASQPRPVPGAPAGSPGPGSEPTPDPTPTPDLPLPTPDVPVPAPDLPEPVPTVVDTVTDTIDDILPSDEPDGVVPLPDVTLPADDLPSLPAPPAPSELLSEPAEDLGDTVDGVGETIDDTVEEIGDVVGDVPQVPAPLPTLDPAAGL